MFYNKIFKTNLKIKSDIELKYHVFIAHSAKDTAIAKDLYYNLISMYHVFLDSQSLLPGDMWDTEIQKAQANSLITIMLVSNKTELSYYQKEEIANSIDLARNEKHFHRIIPVYIEGRKRTKIIPYGLRRINGVYLSEGEKINVIIPKLNKLIESLKPELYGLKYKSHEYWDYEENLHDTIKDNTSIKLTNTETFSFELIIQDIARNHFDNKQPVSIIYLDLDGFSNINKQYGNKCGDTLIKSFENLLFESFENDYNLRLGEDEFVICMRRKQEDALIIAEEFRETIEKFEWDNIVPNLFITASFGVSQLVFSRAKHNKGKEFIEEVDEWIVKAIHGSMLAKRKGGNKVIAGPLFLPKSVSRSYRDYGS